MNTKDAAFRLDLAIWSLEGHDLVTPGTVVTHQVLADVVKAGRDLTWPSACLLEYGTVRRDLARVAREGAYRTVFGNDEEYRDLERLMATVQLPAPCLRGLDWFRDHDFYTYRHILMVFALSCLLAQRAGLDGAEAAAEIMAGPLHDFGKLCIPIEVLTKNTPLLRFERGLLEQHTLAGHVLLCYYFKNPEAFTTLVARDHHERRDGSGYPRGIALDSPLVEIVAVCDIYDALVSPRPYRKKSFDNRSALEEITDMAARGKIGWDIVRLLVAQNRKDRPAPEKVEISLEKRGSQPEGNLYGIIQD